jgi:acetyl-CoA acetyltransferase
MAYRAEIPYGAYWSTPFAKWQGSFAHLHSIEFGAHVAKAELARRDIAPAAFDFGVLGTTVPQKSAFHGLPWFMGMIGAAKVGGPTINQACATGVRCLLAAAQEIEADLASTALVATCDRISNGPHIVYPNPSAPGGTASHENWVMDNFSHDPLGGHAMVNTAENVARKYQVTTAEQHDVVLRRVEQYAAALADGRAFQKRYMTLPFDVPRSDFKKSVGTVAGDEGVVMSTAEGLARLKPVLPDGTVTYGGQTHPADGSAAVIVTTPEKSQELSRDSSIRVSLKGFGLARADLAHMRRPQHDEQLRLLVDLGPSAGADRAPLRHRADRGIGDPWRRTRPVPGLCRRGHGDGRGHRRRPAQALSRFVIQIHQRLPRYASMHSADALA